eukprot:84471_1
MSKRSREYFESFKEFNLLCTKEGVHSPPKQKRAKLSNTINKDSTPPSQIKKTILSASLSLSPSPSPPQILLNKHNNNNNNKNVTDEETNNNSNKTNKVFDDNIFYIANIGIKNKRTGVRKVWSDLNKNRIKIFNTIIPNNGGQIIENINKFNNSNNINNKLTIIVSEKINRYDFDELFDKTIQENNNYIFVTPEYITESLKNKNKKLSKKHFKPKCLNEKIINKKEVKNNKKAVQMDKKDEKEKDDKEIKKKTDWLDRNKDKFACQIENDGHKVNFNSNISDIFDEMESIYSCLGDKWREYGYKKANGFIKKYPKKIETETDIKNLIKMKGFSKKLGEKVLEIITTGTLRKLDELSSMPQIKTIKLFTNIFGVGSITAQQWYNIGLRSLEDVRNAEKWDIKLQDRQRMGLKYYDDLLIKIPRTEIICIEKFIVSEINDICVGCKVIICGSYRRGKLKSGDIDILITHPQSEYTHGLLMRVVNRFHDIGFLVDDLSVPSGRHKDDDDHDSYMGIARMIGDEYKYYRHVDIKIYKPEHFAFAVLYFTGSDHFNRSMRYFAKRKGFTLSDTQLAPAIRQNNSKIFTFTAKAIKCSTEQEIFEALGLKYIK